MEEELRLACEIQTGLLPKCDPEIEHYAVTGTSLPARVVGGDYFDYLQIDDNRYAFCLGDISGKGLPAAVLMANLQASIRGLVLSDPQPHRCLAHANTMLYRNTAPSKFATFFYGVLDCRTQTFTYGNAGHNRPVLLSESGEIKELQTAGLALGFLELTPYETDTITLETGDTLMIYSDGVTEAMDPGFEEFGEEKLYSLLKSNSRLPIHDIQTLIVDAVQTHAKHQPQSDDITLMLIRRVG